MSFDAESALTIFELALSDRGLKLEALTPAEGVSAMLDFYRSQRAEDCDVEEDGDMLLFQWGTYDWGSGEHFELDITRQLAPDVGEFDFSASQLSLTFLFEPSGALRALGEGNRWAYTPEDLSDFESFVRGSAALQAVASRTDGRVELDFDPVG